MDDSWTKEIGARIRDLRDKRGWSQPQLADLLVVHLKSVGNYEKGKIPFRDLSRIAEVLETDMRWLLFGAEYKDPIERIEEKLDRLLIRLPASDPESEQAQVEAETEARARQSEQTSDGSSTEKPGRKRKAH